MVLVCTLSGTLLPPQIIYQEYQFVKEFLIFLLNSSLPATSSGCISPVHDAGTNTILISLSSSLSLIYQGKTNLCHAKCKFPEGWNVTHSENYWSNEQTMQEYAENVLIPCVESVVDEYPLTFFDTCFFPPPN
jgi:hypothetical protein